MIPHVAFQGRRAGSGSAPPVELPAVIQANAWSQPVWALQTGAGVLPRSAPIKVPGVDANAPGMAVADQSGGGLDWKTVTITGADRIVAGWDFTGCLVIVRGPRCTVEDNKFAPPKIWKSSTSEIVASSYALTVGSGADDVADAIVRYNDFDGGEGDCNTAILLGTGAARALVSNNRYRFFGSDNIKSMVNATSNADRPVIQDSYCDLGGYGSPLAHYDAITVGRGGAHIRRILFNETARAGAYGLTNAVRCQADTAGWQIDNVLIEDCVSFGRTGAGLPFQNSNDNGAVGSVRYRRLIVAPNGAGNVFGTSQADSEGTVEISNVLRFPDGAAIAIPALKPGGFSYTPTIASVPSGAGAGVEVGTFAAFDINGDAISYALQDSAGGRFAIGSGNKLVTGLVATDHGAAQSHTLTVRISDSGGKYMDRTVTIAVSEAVGLPTISVDQASVRFPAVHERVTNPNASHISYLRAASPWSTTGTLFNTDQAFIFSLELTHDEVEGGSASNVFGVLGNTGNATLTPTSNRTFGILYGGKRHATLAGKLGFFLNSETANQADWVKAELDVSGYQRLLIAFRRVGSDFFFEAWHRGARVAQWTRAVGSFAATASRISVDYIIGCMGTAAAGSVPLVSGSLSGFIGSIGMIGTYFGTVADADLAAISIGADPLTQLAAANWKQFRRLKDTTTESLTKPATATGDTTAAFTAVGAGFEKGSDILPVEVGAGWIAPNFIRNGFVWGRLAGQTSRSVTFSGGASASLAGETIEIRFFDDATGQLTRNWTAVGTIGGDGSWSGSVILQKNNGWGGADFRLASDPTKIHRLRSKVGVGLKFAVWGQSQVQIALKATGTAKVPSPDAALSICLHDTTNGPITLKVSRPDRPVSDAAAVMADLVSVYTAEPVCIVGYVREGSSIGDLLDDTLTGRQWSDVTLINAVSGDDVSASVINWFGEDMGTQNIGEGYLDPLIRGDAPSGSLHTPYTVQHHLNDGTFQPGMAIVLSPPTRFTNTVPITSRDFSGDSMTNNRALALRAFYDYPSGHLGAIAAIGPSLDDMAIVPGGGAHEPTNVDEGPSRVARRLLVGLMRGMGLDTTTDPVITGAALTSGGASIDVSVSRPNGGSIQTAWALKSVAVPSGYTTVQGFEVQSGGAGAWSRSGFTAEVVDAAAGLVRLTKASGTWPAGTKVKYLDNGPLDFGLPTEADRPYHGMLYESGPLEGGLGLPVRGLWVATL